MNQPQGRSFVDFVYNVDRLNVIFALSSVAMAICMVWMVWDDYDREWKDFQREAMALDRAKAEADLRRAEERVDKDALGKLEGEIEGVEAQIRSSRDRVAPIRAEVGDLKAAFYRVDQNLKFEKAMYDVARYEYEEASHAGHTEAAAKKRAELDTMVKRMEAFRIEKEEVEVRQAQAQARLDEIVGAQSELERRKAALTKEVAQVERRLSAVVPSFQNQFRNLPMLDFIDPSIEIRQIVLGDLRNDINFTQVPKVDRCTTCHVNIDRRGYELDKETGSFADQDLRAYMDEAYVDPETRSGRSRMWASHPDIDVYAHSASPHPASVAGCTSCHYGRDRGVTFVQAAHTPDSPEEAERWERLYHWHKMHHWDHPMLPMPHVEASCGTCHQGVTNIPRAADLNRGRHLVRTLGCHGCHKIEGFTDQRKVGPDLRNLAGKLDRDWTAKWIRDPRGFRPTTKMPKIFDLSNVSSPEDIARSSAGIQAITTYLFEKSQKPTYPAVPVSGDAGRGRALVAKVGCRACHVVGLDDELGQDYDLRNFGPNLNEIGSKVSARWLFAWLKDPKQYFPDTLMPNLRLSDQEAADIGSYLLTLRNGDFDRRSPAAADPRVRDDLALDFLKGRLPVREAEKQLAGMTALERALFVGERMISRQGCYGCHLIPGFEAAQPIGTELTEEGSKDVDKLDFALNPTNIPHTRYDWFFQKLKDPRVFDQGKVKSFADKLRMPNFGLSDGDALSLTTALMSFSKSFVTHTARRQLKPRELEIEKGRKLVYERNCRGCHILENEGGAVRAPLVWTYGNEGVAESEAVGFTPPVLNGEGRKVQPNWLFSFLKEVVPIRPWLEVRMPTFGFDDKGATDITTYFSRLDEQQFPYSTFEHKSLSPNDLRGSQVLFSQDVFNCWTCHQQGSVKPKGDPASWAPDLTMARERLKEDWIKAWLWDPQKIQPGTKMPTFFGDTTVYLPEEMTRYLHLPEGVRPEGGVLQAPTDPVIQLIADYIIHGLHQGQQVTMR